MYSWQMYDVSAQLISEFPALREPLYSAFEKNVSNHSFGGAEEIVIADGLMGFEFVINHLSKMDFENDGWEFRSYIEKLEEQLGKNEAWDAIALLNPPNNPRYQELLSAVKTQDKELEKKWKSRKKPYSPKILSLSKIVSGIVSGGTAGSIGVLRRWSVNCTNENEIHEAARFIETTTNTEHLNKLLRLFWKKSFPNSPERLIELAHNEDETLASSAMRAMHCTASPLIRDLALKFASEGRLVHEIPGLLIKNYQDGDDMLVTELLKIQLDDFEYHTINMYARDFFEAHPKAHCEQAMLLIYENNPCSLCRGRALSLIVTSGKEIPTTILAEAAWDCDLSTREEIVALTKATNA